MTEILAPISPANWRRPWAVCLWEIMVREALGFAGTDAKSDIEQKFNIPSREQRGNLPLTVEVEMKINGVPVNFEQSFTELWERMSGGYEQHVLEKAKELVSGTRLGKLQDIIERFEWELQNEVETLYNQQKKG